MEGVFIKDYLGGTIGKILNKFVEKKTGFSPRVNIRGLDLKVEETYVTVDISLSLSKENFDKLIMEVTK